MRLVAEGLEARRGGLTLFSGLSFSLEPGRALLIRGPNGAGKSTLLRITAGLLAPAAGRVFLEGGRLGADAHFLSTENAMKPALSVAENLGFWRRFLADGGEAGMKEHGSRRPGIGGMDIAPALDAVGLGSVAALPFAVLSTGQRRRVALARLLVRPRALWLLDEPGSGLDAQAQSRLAGLMREHLGHGGMIMAAVHDDPGLQEAQELRLDDLKLDADEPDGSGLGEARRGGIGPEPGGRR